MDRRLTQISSWYRLHQDDWCSKKVKEDATCLGYMFDLINMLTSPTAKKLSVNDGKIEESSHKYTEYSNTTEVVAKINEKHKQYVENVKTQNNTEMTDEGIHIDTPTRSRRSEDGSSVTTASVPRNKKKSTTPPVIISK